MGRGGKRESNKNDASVTLTRNFLFKGLIFSLDLFCLALLCFALLCSSGGNRWLLLFRGEPLGQDWGNPGVQEEFNGVLSHCIRSL